ncbi:LytR C-terminal domain-containing protein [Candidatus Mycobacterium methanotrophicum]|uniref:LytR C-terminal domain-containing protein n=1 Tax=Candidatus Mycobacterium methanotrophicum TaxID=2943498 RepID=A0ABY4QPQ3_9MYCO|nr:LytR C-terminal domain-containing protein [Candidatus Mycobacterium methanotrophicum]UQX11941.1 LytR C-terminal domain-containing protein [Candidatus Mycobacterium methanotrophicum]
MSERLPDSTGLPLRAMVMVLLFLGVIFLLVGFQAMGSGTNSEDDSAGSTVTASAMPSKTSVKPAPNADVRVYNISGRQGVAGHTADQLKHGGFNVTDVGNLSLPDVSATTVYFTDAPGERETADGVGQLLKAHVEPRTREVADQPPGVIVVVVR